MHRIYQKFTACVSQTITLEKSSSHHLINVLRVKKGEDFVLFNGHGGEYIAEIVDIKKNHITAHLKEFINVQRESPVFIHLAQGIARGEKMDFIIQKAVELGINKITPLFTEFCNVKLSNDRLEKKLQHWQQIVISAVEQCGRTEIPKLCLPQNFKDWIKQCQENLKLLLHPNAEQNLKNLAQSANSICLVVGSEGGLSEKEIELATQFNFISLQLGPRILRTETAGLAATALLQHRYGDFQ